MIAARTSFQPVSQYKVAWPVLVRYAVCVPASPPPAIVDEEERLALALVLMHAAWAVHPAVALLVSVSMQWRGLALAATPIF